MTNRLDELDSTALTTGATNWLKRKKDALLAAGGSGRALGRHSTRLVANKLYKSWTTYLGSQGKAGTAAELSNFISRFYGQDNLTQLSQEFPQVLPPAPPAPPGSPPGGATGPTPPGAPPGGPTAPTPPGGSTAPPGAARQPPDDHASMNTFQNYMKRINQYLASPTPDVQRVTRLVGSMLRDFSRRSPKAQDWVRQYFKNTLEPHASTIPALQQFVGQDPFTLVPQRTPRAAQPGTQPPPQQGQPPPPPPPAQPQAATAMPQPPQPFRSQPPPAFLQRQKNESRLMEAPKRKLAIPKPPKNAKTTTYRNRASNLGQPPAFMRQPPRQAPQAAPAAPAAPQAVTRAQVDAIFVKLAQMLMDQGQATVGGGQPQGQGQQGQGQGQQQQQQQQRSGGGAANVGRVMQARISKKALNQAYMRAGLGTPIPRETAKVEQVFAQNPNPTVAEFIAAMGTMSSALTQGVMYATEYA